MHEDDLLADLLAGAVRSGLLEQERIEAAFRVACQAHRQQQREDGSPYVHHPIRAARILLEEWEVREGDLIVAALLHDVVEKTELELPQIAERFGDAVSTLVDHLSKPVFDRGLAGAEAARDEAYWKRLADGPAGAVVVKAADRVDNLRSVVRATWPEAEKRAYAEESSRVLLPIVRAQCPKHAGALEATITQVLEALDRGEGDMPDVGPHQGDALGGGSDEDPVLRTSRHLSFFRNGPDIYLYHDLIGDIIQLHETVLGFLDFFTEPKRWSEACAAFAEQFQPPDLEEFLHTLTQHLVLLRRDGEDEETTLDWYPNRGPWIVSYDGPKAVVLAYKDRRSRELVTESLPPLLGRLFSMCQGNLRTSELIKRLEREFPKEEDVAGRVRRAVRRWSHSQRQLLKLLPRNREAYDMPGVGVPPYASSTMPYDLLRRSAEPPPELGTDTYQYHRLEVEDADEQFDLKETTLSHALRIPHPALDGRTYGSAMAKALVDRDVLPESDADRIGTKFSVVEVGGGTGFFAKAFLDGLAISAPRLFNRLRYTILDLTPALQASQTERTKTHADKVRQLTGNAEALPLADESVDFLISNEVIADLAVTPVRRVDVDGTSGEEGGPGVAVIRQYKLATDDAPGLFFVNTGAIAFLEHIRRVLKPGGTAVLTEYGDSKQYPTISTHLDHPEYSIHFGHLKAVCDALGLESSLESLPSLLGLKSDVDVLHTTQTHFETLRAFLGAHQIDFAKVAYTPEMFAELLKGKLEPRKLQGVTFGPSGKRVLGLKPYEFQALVIRRPRTTGRKVSKKVMDF